MFLNKFYSLSEISKVDSIKLQVDVSSDINNTETHILQSCEYRFLCFQHDTEEVVQNQIVKLNRDEYICMCGHTN